MSRWLLFTSLVFGAVPTGILRAADGPKGLPVKLVTHPVKRQNLPLAVVERTSLGAVRNTDIYCRVRAGTKSALIASIIKWVIDDGSLVKKGELLIELDDSGLQEQIKAQRILLESAAVSKARAEEEYQLVLSSNESDAKEASVNLEVARLDLQKFLNADSEQAFKEIKSRLLLAEAGAVQEQDHFDQVARMRKQGTATESQVRVARLRLEAAELILEKCKLELQAFEKYARTRTETELRGKVAASQTALERFQKLAAAREGQARSDRDTKKMLYEQELSRLKEIEDDIKNCKIYAPESGLVIYHVFEQTRGTQSAIVAQGEPVREGQKLLQIPDLDKLQTIVHVPEELVAQVRPGLTVQLQLDAFPDRKLSGTVAQVATIPSHRNWMTLDEKSYPTVIHIKGDTTGLRPGMMLTATLSLGKTLDNVLVVPSRAILGRGKGTSCLVLTADGPEEREVKIGVRNEQVSEITGGLREGDEVIVNPHGLLTEVRDRVRFLRDVRPQLRREE